MAACVELDPVKCLEKIQLLVLASMPTTSDGKTQQQQLSLSDISARLQLPPQEAESLAVRAIGLGLIDGRIDQETGVVAVRSSLPRSFQREQWQSLKTRLAALKGNITEILAELERVPAA